MRLFVLLFLVLALPASAQNAAPVAPAKFDWKTLGRPLDDDTKSMMDRRVYFNTDTMDKNVSLDKPILSQNTIGTWVSEHMGQVMTLDGRTYDKQVYNNRLLFTPTGYADYIIYLKQTNLATFLKDNQYKVVAFVDGAPNILSEGADANNVYHWQITAVMVLSYLDYRNQPPAAMFKGQDPKKINNRLPIQAKIDLVRVPARGNGTLVAIDHLSFGVVPPPAATESLDPAAVGE